MVSHWPNRKTEIVWTALSLLALLWVCYGNSFQAAWQYDDYPNIIHNERVHMTQINGAQLRLALGAGPPQQVIARPLAYLTFALNYRLGQLDVFGYHVVNFTIHWLAALFLFLWVRGTLTLPIFQQRYVSRATPIAWLAAAFWACHPIQVTSVTYIVQRMTAMEGMFYAMAMYGYMAGRRAQEGRTRYMAYGVCALGAAGALLSKENAVLLIYTLLLYDLFFFQKMGWRTVRRTAFMGLGLTVLLAGLSLLYLDPQNLFKPYENRPFTMAERLLTQPRMLFFYLSLIVLPMTMRLSMLHDVVISHTLLDPWTTLPAMAAVAGAVVLLALLGRRHRLFAFCGLFYFLNHAVESSFLNLELIYEHRNYVPTMLLFLPLAVGAVRSLDFFYYRRSLQAAMAAGLGLWLFAAMHTTWSYNRIFHSEYTLWRHAMAVYPRLSLPYVNLGKLFWHAGEREASYKLNLKAIETDNFQNLHQKGVAYYNLGLYATDDQHDLPAARSWFELARRYYGINPQVWHELAQVHLKLGDFAEAGEVIEKGLVRWPDDPNLLSLMALNSLKTRTYPQAIESAKQLLAAKSEHDKIAWMVLAESHRLMGDTQASLDCWRRLLEMDPDNMAALMALIEMAKRLDLKNELNGYVCRFLELNGADRLAAASGFTLSDPNMMPYLPDLELIRDVLRTSQNHRCADR